MIMCISISWNAWQHVILISCHSDRLFLPWYLPSHSTHVIPDDGIWGKTCLNKNKKNFCYMFKTYLFGYAPSSSCSSCWRLLLDFEDEGTIFFKTMGTVYLMTQCNITGDFALQQYCCEDLKSCHFGLC